MKDKAKRVKTRQNVTSHSERRTEERTISKEHAVDALRRSGYLLENRIAKTLDKFANHLSVNVTFADPETGQARELDAYCYHAETGKTYEFVAASAHVLIECVNNPQPIAFFSSDIGSSHYPITACRPSWLGLYPLEQTIGMHDFHHCLRRGHARNYCTFVEKKSREWMATHADEQHREFTTLALLAQATREKQLKVLDDYSRPQDAVQMCGIEFIYPILVAGGILFDVRQNNSGRVHLKRVDHAIFMKSQMWKGIRRNCPIDVVTEKFLPRFVKMIEVECKRTLVRLERRGPEILEAVNNAKPSADEPTDPLGDYLP